MVVATNEYGGGGDNPAVQAWWYHGGDNLAVQAWWYQYHGGDTKAAHQSPCSSLPPVDPVNNFPRVRHSAIDLPFLRPGATNTINGKVGQSLDRLGGGVWIDGPTLVAAWIEACPGSIALLERGAPGRARVSPNHPRPGITSLPNTELPPITLSVTKILVCTEPGQGWPQYSC